MLLRMWPTLFLIEQDYTLWMNFYKELNKNTDKIKYLQDIKMITYKVSLYKYYSSKLFGDTEEMVYEIDNLDGKYIEECIYDFHKILLNNRLSGKIAGKYSIRVFEKKGDDYVKFKEKIVKLSDF